MNFFSNLTEVDLQIELKRRSLPTMGTKEELISVLRDAVLLENINEIFNEEENYDSEDEDLDLCSENKEVMHQVESSTPVENNTTKTIINNKTKDKINVNKKRSFKVDIDIDESETVEINEDVIIIDDEDNDLIKDDIDVKQLREDNNECDKDRNIVWVYKITKDVKAVDLKELFEKYGKVLSVKIVMNGKSGTGNCFGCIQLNDDQAVKNCIRHLHRTKFRGNTISVTKNINDITHAELIDGNISQVSSNDSFGSAGDGARNQKKKEEFVKPIVKTTTATKVTKSDSKHVVPYREKMVNRGNNYNKDRARLVQDYRNPLRNSGSRTEWYGEDQRWPAFHRDNANHYFYNDHHHRATVKSYQRRDVCENGESKPLYYEQIGKRYFTYRNDNNNRPYEEHAKRNGPVRLYKAASVNYGKRPDFDNRPCNNRTSVIGDYYSQNKYQSTVKRARNDYNCSQRRNEDKPLDRERRSLHHETTERRPSNHRRQISDCYSNERRYLSRSNNDSATSATAALIAAIRRPSNNWDHASQQHYNHSYQHHRDFYPSSDRRSKNDNY